MANFAYINGQYCHHYKALTHVEDRGYQFADAVYEVIPVVHGKLIDEQPHLERIQRSMNEIRMVNKPKNNHIKIVTRELLHKNHVKNGAVYMQISRGVSSRDFTIPKNIKPCFVVTTKHMGKDFFNQTMQGIAAYSQADIRWGRCDIKTVALLPAVLAKDASKQKGGKEAVFVDNDGNITEGGSSNIFMVTKDNILVTRPASNHILNGITRQTIIHLAEIHQMRVEERIFSLDELQHAKEAFFSAATTFAKPILTLDEKQMGNGKAGEFTKKIHQYFANYIEKTDIF